MSRLVSTLFAVALLALVASTASAIDKYPPGPSYRSCGAALDSVTIFEVQQADTTLNPCYPAIGDTVGGIRGVITGFRLRSTGRIYIENTNAADYNGLQIYTVSHTEAPNAPWNFVIGDSVSVVTGVSQAYQGESQIQGAITGATPSLIVARIVAAADRGNVLPPFRLGTTSDYKWSPATGPGSAFATCNPREGELVRVNGPLKVARGAAGAGLFNPTNWLLVNENGSAPGDSILVDGYTLTAANIGAPTLGQRVDWVRGILRRATNNGVDCWLITLRDGNDQQVLASPNLSEAFPIAENKVRLYFDKNVDVTTAQNTANYQLDSWNSGSTVDNATVVGGVGSVVDLTITDALAHAQLEGITTQNITSVVCPACLSPQQSLSFVLGVLSCAEVQAPLADSLGGVPCLDKSRFAMGGSAWGSRLTVRGVYVQQYGTLRFLEDAAGGLRSGVAAYNVPFGMTVGNKYLLACRVQEFYGMTELANPAALIDEGAVAVPSPQLQTVGVLNSAACDPLQNITNAEDYEGVLVRVQNVKVVPFNTDPVLPSQGGSFRIVALPACADTILVSSLGGTYADFTPVVNQWLNINGVLNIDTDVPRILPRNSADITVLGILGVPGTTPAKVAFSVGPSPARVTNVRFTLPKQADVDLSVFDLSGRKVVTLAKGSMPARSYEYKWDGASAGVGVYFVRLRVGSEIYNLRTISLK